MNRLKIENDIALIASGTSVNDLPEGFISSLMDTHFVITINYAPLAFPSHLNVWYDKIVSEKLTEHYADKPKDRLFMCKPEAKEHTNYMRQNVDIVLDRNIKGHFTIVQILFYLQKHHPDNMIYIYGLDMYAPNYNTQKWYDVFTNFDKFRRVGSIEKDLYKCRLELNSLIYRKNIINCNPESNYKMFKFKD